MTNKRTGLNACLGLLLIVGAGCSDYRSEGQRSANNTSRYESESETTIRRFKQKDPSLDRFFTRSVGYAVLPVVTKGGLGVGAAHGARGVLYEGGSATGDVELTQITVGAQIGGQDFAEIIFFEHNGALEDFKHNNTEFAANASAVAATSGAGASSDFANGVAVFTIPLGGLMAEASIGGQKFRYTPYNGREAYGRVADDR